MRKLKTFYIAGGTYELSAINNLVVITRKYQRSNAVSSVSVSFSVSSNVAAQRFVIASTENDVKRGIAKMQCDLDIAERLTYHLQLSTQPPATTKTDYTQFLNKNLKR